MPHLSLSANRRAVLLGLAGATLASRGHAQAPVRAWPRASALLADHVSARKVSGVSLAIRMGAAAPQFSNFGALAFDAAPADEHTLWRIFSMSKPITGVAALALAEEGKLSLSQPVSDFVPEFATLKVLETGATRPARTPMLVFHLFTHTAGLGYAINDATPLAALYAEAVLLPGDPTRRANAPQSLDAFGARLATLPLGADPGTRYEYSVGPDLLGLVIQRASGMPFEAYLKARLFDPLGMNDTGFRANAQNAARLSQNYVVRGGVVAPLEPVGRSPYLTAPAYPSGGGGLLSTAHDYDRFCAMLQNDGVLDGVRVLSRSTARRAHSNLLPPGVLADGGMKFGAGMGIVTRASAVARQEPPGAYGWAGAAGTLMWIDPVHRLSVVMMTQYMPSGAYPIWAELKRAIYADLSGHSFSLSAATR